MTGLKVAEKNSESQMTLQPVNACLNHRNASKDETNSKSAALVEVFPVCRGVTFVCDVLWPEGSSFGGRYF